MRHDVLETLTETEQCKLFDEDACQEARLNILKLGATDTIRSPRRYARSSVRSAAIRQRVRQQREEDSRRAYALRITPRCVPSPLDELGHEDDLAAVRSVIEALPPRQREAIELVYLQRLTRSEAAVIMGTTAPAMNSLVHRALAQLKTQITSPEGSHSCLN